ncbi:Metal-sulfur cluster biosynthetic enzyme [Raineyella antarctica]|uniref:Metal-sulfur cluster biosynthetic enzyme n=1 Tax=Raineyella antarctica TaxID=1577474 RepID=A0A1G6GHK5_9ACTN|nr:iron-sulfur cluster assembly protein [Raineyella antarctica]SDB81430.1 Metal-sulfur cluster biosynthetic enzyme [Raineyella antarctica]
MTATRTEAAAGVMAARGEDVRQGGGREGGGREEDVREALSVVLDPELDEPITDLGFVRSIEVSPAAGTDADPDDRLDTHAAGALVVVHLRLPTSFCSPNFAYLMASDSKDALSALPGVGRVVVELDDHHDSDLINAGLAADAGYRGTFGHEAEESLDELRWIFRRKAHTAAMERCLTALLRADRSLAESAVGTVRLQDLPAGREKDALLRRRVTIGLPTEPRDLVLVDEAGCPYPPEAVPMALRRARSTRISVDGNAHFCRGLLRTRYAGAGADQVDRPEGAEPSDHHLLPLIVKEIH